MIRPGQRNTLTGASIVRTNGSAKNRERRFGVLVTLAVLLFISPPAGVGQTTPPRPSSSMDTLSTAYLFFSKGRELFKQAISVENPKIRADNLNKAVSCFEKAVSRDSTFDLAYLGLARCYSTQSSSGFLTPEEAFSKIEAAATKVIQLNDSYAEPHQLLAWQKYQFGWDWVGAEEEFKRALELDPKLAEPWPRYASLLASLGRFNEAWAEVRREEDLNTDPASVNFSYGYILYWTRRYDDAVKYYQGAIDANPKSWLYHFFLGLAEVQASRYDDAIEEFRKGVILSGSNAGAVAGLGYGYAVAGKKKEATNVLEMLKKGWERKHSGSPAVVPPYRIAAIHAALGNKEEALSWLEKGLQTKSAWMVWLMVDPAFNSFHKDSRFLDLLNKMGFKK